MSAEKPADKQYHAPEQHFHNPYRYFRQTFAERHQKRVTGTAALFRAHIYPHTQRHKNKSRQHYSNTDPDVFVRRKRIRGIEHLHEIAGEQRIYYRSEAYPLFQQNIYYQNCHRYNRHGNPIVEGGVICNSHTEAVPRSKPDIGVYGKMHTERKNQQSCHYFQPAENDPAAFVVFSFHCLFSFCLYEFKNIRRFGGYV